MIRSTTVISAIHHLHRRYDQWPTAQEIARYLVCDDVEVRLALRELKAARIMRNAQRQKRKVWMPWDAA